MKKQKEQYSREISIHKAAFGMDSDACAAEALKLVNSDITGIVFSAAIAKGFPSADMRGFRTENARKGWRTIYYDEFNDQDDRLSTELCAIGPMSENVANNPESETIDYTYQFEWYRK